MASNGIHIACAYMTRCFAPRLEGSACGSYGSINIGAIGSSHLRQQFASCWIYTIDVLTAGRLDPLVINEQAKGRMFLDPCQPRSSSLGSRSIFHRIEDFHH